MCVYLYKLGKQDLKAFSNLLVESIVRTGDWKLKLEKFKREIRQKYLMMRMINLWKTVESAYFSIPCYCRIKAESLLGRGAVIITRSPLGKPGLSRPIHE